MLMSQEYAGRLTKAHASGPLGFGRQTLVNKWMGIRELADRAQNFRGGWKQLIEMPHFTYEATTTAQKSKASSRGSHR